MTMSKLTCPCCGWRWESQEKLEDHLEYMRRVGLLDG